MALFLAHCPSELIPSQIHWKYSEGNKTNGKNVYVNLKVLFDKIYSEHSINSTQFVLFCILAETDYVQKKWISFFSGLEHILSAVKRTPELLLIDTNPQQLKNALEQYVLALFTVKIQCSRQWTNPRQFDVMSKEQCKLYEHYTPKSRWPTPDDMQQAQDMILFNYNYWKENWKQYSIAKEWKEIQV